MVNHNLDSNTIFIDQEEYSIIGLIEYRIHLKKNETPNAVLMLRASDFADVREK